MDETQATVIIPTTKGRGPVLPYSVGSVQRQTIKEIEIFIIGDGVDEPTRKIIYDLKASDQRIYFFDYAKGPRRGEIYRHKALMNNAKGKIVCYLTDRDIMLRDHVELMLDNLMEHDFCVQSMICV